MGLLFRLFILLVKIAVNRGRQNWRESVELSFRVLPTDCDINLHLTNARYPAMMDLSRIWMLARVGAFGDFLRKRWLPVLSASAITYIRDIRPFEKFTVSARVVGWDHKYFYIEQHFRTQRGLMAVGYVRGVFLCRGKVVPVEDIEAYFGPEGALELPQEIVHWKAMLEQKKKSNMS